MVNIIYAKTLGSQIACLSKLIAEQEESLYAENLVFCEDRFTLSLEDELLQKSERRGFFATKVFSFSRYASHLQRNEEKKKTLSKAGGIMAMSKILASSAPSLSYLKQRGMFSPLAASVYELIAQLKSSNITSSALSPEALSGSVRNKTADVKQLFEKYEEFKQNSYLDAQDKIELLTSALYNTSACENSNVFVVGFPSFTKQFVGVLVALAKRAKNLTLFLYSFDNPSCDFQSVSAIKAAFASSQILFSESETGFPITPEKDAITRALFSYNEVKQVETNAISLHLSSSFSYELTRCLKRITSLVRYENYSYSDFTVMLPSLPENLPALSERFAEFGIPFFADEKQSLVLHPLSRYVFSILLLSGGHFDLETVTDFIKNPLFPVFPGFDANSFENFLIKTGACEKAFRSSFVFSDELTQKTRDAVLSELLSLDKAASISSYCASLISLVKTLAEPCIRLSEKYDALSEKEFAALSLQAADRLVALLQEMDEILGQEIVSLDEFATILSSGLAKTELSNAPLYLDSVFVGDFTSSKISSRRVVFSLLTNDMLVPFVKTDVAILNDRDIDILKTRGVNLEPKIDTVNRRERLNVILAMCAFTERLEISFSNVSDLGDALLPSEIIDTFSKTFTFDGKPLEILSERTDKTVSETLFEDAPTPLLAKKLYALSIGKALGGDERAQAVAAAISRALSSLSEDKALPSIRSTLVEKVPTAFDLSSLFSVSLVEKYYDCPYKAFLAYSLYAREREEGKVLPPDSGNYIHKALELYQKSRAPVSDEELLRTIDSVLYEAKLMPPFDRLDKIPRYHASIARLDFEAERVIRQLYLQASLSNFKPLGAEIAFGYKTGFPAVVLPNNVKMKGKIDYADGYEKYVRVIDYKTGQIKDALGELYVGKKIQPFLYLDALCQNDKLPAAALYFPISDSFSSDEDDAYPYRMKGYVLSNALLAAKMDSSLSANSKSELLPLSLNKDGSVSKTHTLSDSQFAACCKYSKLVAARAIDKIAEGDILPNPLESACNYCKAKGACGFDKNVTAARVVPSLVSGEQIEEVVKNATDN